MLSLLYTFLCLVVVLLIAKYLIDWLELDPPARKIAILIVGILALMALVHRFGAVGGVW